MASELSHVVDALPGFVWAASPHGEMEFANQKWRDYTGFEADQSCGQGWQAAIHADDLPRLLANWQLGAKRSTFVETEARVRGSDGRYRRYRFRADPIADVSGNVIKWCGLAIESGDRTVEHVSAEAAQCENERNSLQIIGSVPGIVLFFMTPDGRHEVVSPQMARYFGKTPEQLSNWATDDTIHHEDRSHAVEVFLRAIASGEPYKFEARFRRHDGVYQWFQCRGRPRRDEAGRIVRWHCVGIDIDDRKQAEDALRHSEARLIDAERELQLTIDNIPVRVATYSADGTRVSANKWVRDSMGGAPIDRWRERVHPDDIEDVESKWRACLASGEPFEFSYRFRMADGMYRWQKARRVPLRDANGKIVRWYSSGHDIEDQRRAEELLSGEKQLLEMVASGRPMPEALAALCRLGESTAGGSYCSIVLVDPDVTKLQEAVAPSLPREFNDAVRGWPLDRLGGPCVTAARDNVQVIMPDVASDSRWRTSWRALAQKHGLRSCWSTPIVSQAGKVLGTFALYWREPGSPNPLQLDLIKQFTSIASIAIDRAQRDEALRKSEARRAAAERDLQLMIDTIPVFVAAYEPDGTRTFVNRTWQDYMGLTLADVCGPTAKVFPHFHPDDAERNDSAWQAALASGEPLSIEVRVRRADGQYRWHTSRRVPLRDDKGEIVRWYSVGIDIHDQKVAEDALRVSEERLVEAERDVRLTLDSIPVMTWRASQNGKVLSGNKRWYDYTGSTADQVREGQWQQFVHPDDLPDLLATGKPNMPLGKPTEGEARVRRHDGAYRWFLFRVEPARDESGEIFAWYGTITDIEDKRSAELALRKSEAELNEARRELQLTIDTIPVLVASYLPDGTRTFINQTWQGYTGLAPQDVTGQINTTFPHFHPDDAARLEPAIRASLASGEPLPYQVRLRGTDGAYRWHSVRRVPLRDENGTIIRWYSTGFDIHDQKVAEASLRQSEGRLAEAERDLRLTLDSIPTMTWRAAANGYVQSVNKRWYDYTGCTPEQVQDGGWQSFVHPDDLTELLASGKRNIPHGDRAEAEARLRRFDGEYRWFLFRVDPARDEAGKIVAWHGAITDIEDRKNAEAALRQSEAQLQDAQRDLQRTIDSIPAKVATYEPDGTRSFVNQQWRDYVNMTLDEAIRPGGQVPRQFHPDDAERADRAWRKTLATGEPLTLDMRIRGGDGEYRWHTHHCVPLHDAQGRVVKWYAAEVDIEDKKRAEEALQRSEMRLAQTERELRLTIDSIPAMVATYEPDGTRIFVNQQWQNYTGRSLDEATGPGRHVMRQFHPDEADEVERVFWRSLKDGEPIALDLRVKRADGEYRWHNHLSVPLRDEHGKVTKWFAIEFDIEDRKRAEEALQRSETRLVQTEREVRLMLDSIPTITWRSGPNGYVQHINKRWYEYTGTTPEQSQGTGWQSCVHPDDLGQLMATGDHYIPAGQPIDAEARLRRFDGEYRWFLFRPAAARDETGKVVGWYGIVTDIEDRKRAEGALQHSEARLAETERELRLTLDTIPTIAWHGGPNGYVKYLNKRWFEYTGTTPDQMHGSRWKSCVHPDDIDQLVEIGIEYVTTGLSIDGEARLRRFDGEYRWFLFRPAPARDESGNITGWYGSIIDIDDQKRAEQAVAASERNLRLTIDTIPAMIVRGGTNGYIHYFSKQWFEYTGTTLETARGFRWWGSIHPEDKDRLVEFGARFVANEEPADCEARLRRFDGSYRWFLFRPAPSRDESGKFIGWYGTVTDIEDQKRAEQALVASEHNLQLTIDTIPALAWSSHPDGSAAFANKHYQDFVGLSLEQLKGAGWTAAIHPDDVASLVSGWKSMMASGQGGEIEGRLRRFDGEYRHLMFRTSPLRDEAGNIIKWYGVNTDIEDRKRAEANLANEKQLLEMIASGRPLRDVLNTLCRFVEESAPGSLCGVHPIDWSGPTFEYGIAPSLPASFSAAVAGLAVSGDLLPCGVAAREKAQIISADFETDPRWLTSPVRTHALEHGVRSVWSTPIFSNEGRVLGTFCVFHRKPATPSPHHQNLIAHATHIASIAIERSRTEAALRRSETMLSEGQRISSTGSFSWRIGTDELTFSEELYRIFELDRGTTVTFDQVRMRVHPEDAPLLAERMKQVRVGRATAEQEIRLRMPDQRVKYLRTVGHLISQEDGRTEYLGAIQDVTLRRSAEEALDKVRSELAHVTRVMSLGALTASIAHEVNQPLAGIITNASTCLRMLAADPPNVDGARETARRTIRDGNRAADVITRLRALFSKRAVASEVVDLSEAAQEVLALAANDLLRARVILHAHLGSEPLLVTGDRVQLQQVILNLVRNAADAMGDVDDRPRRLLIKTEMDGEGAARLTVTDAGVGIEPQTAERLFDAFYTTKSSGMGIGLSVSRSIVESHGGRIWVERNDGPGATFAFSIPRRDASAADDGGTHDAILTRPTAGAHDRIRNAEW